MGDIKAAHPERILEDYGQKFYVQPVQRPLFVYQQILEAL